MAWKNIKQRSLVEGFLIEHKALTELDDVDTFIDWARIESFLSDIHSKPRGEKSWPPLMMFKALLLQSWYGLSDPGLEKQLARDLLFRRFTGLGITESVPEHSSIWRFRQILEKNGLLTKLQKDINDQLAEQGLIVRAGEVSIIDASVIEAKNCRPNKGVHGQPTQDREAAWNVKNGSDGKRKSTYGFKGHLNVDEDGFIKKTDFSPGNVHDSQHFEGLLTGNEKAAYADAAYQSQAHDTLLKEQGIDNRLIKRPYRNRPLTQEEREHNRRHSPVRSTVERVFGVLKQHYGMAKARYDGLARNRTRFNLICIAYNLKHGLSLLQGQFA